MSIIEKTFIASLSIWLACIFPQSSLNSQSIADSLVIEIERVRGDDSLIYKNYTRLFTDALFYDLNNAKIHNDSQLYYAQKINSDAYTAEAYAYAGVYYRFIGEYDQAIEQTQKSLTYLEEGEYDKIYSTNLFNLGVIMDHQGRYEESIRYFLEYLKLNEKNERWGNVGQAHNSISLLYKAMGDTEQSLQSLYKSLEIFTKHGSENDIGLAMGNLATQYMDLGNWDSTFHYAQATLEIGNKLKLDRTIGFASYTLAECYIRKREYEKALIHAERAREIYLRYPDKQLSFHNYISLSTIQRELGKLNSSHNNLLIAQQIADSLKFLEGQKTAFNYLSQYYELTADHKKALESHKKYKIIQDSILNEKNTEIINKLNLQYETAKKDAEIKSQNLEISRKTGQRNLLIFGLALLGLLSTLFITRFRLRQRLTEEKLFNLNQKQKLIAADYMVQGQEEERKRIAKDLHDGLGGLLATARLQLQNLQDETDKISNMSLVSKAEQLINDAYSEVRRIAHNMMPNALANLGLRAAIKDLADHINATKEIFVETQLMAGEQKMPEKTQIILFRIIQEALNNVIKHAKATQAIIQLAENNDSYHLTIEDNGIGFELSDDVKLQGMGIRSIESRSKFLNADLHIDSQKGKGTTYDIVVPKPS